MAASSVSSRCLAVKLRAHRLGAADVRQHLRRLVDGDDRVAERDQRMGDPPGPASQLKDGGPVPARLGGGARSAPPSALA